MKKMKILLITNLFPNPQEPLRGIFVRSMAKPLAEMADVTVVSPLPWFPRLALFKRTKWHAFSLVPDEFMVDGIRVVSPKYIALPKIGFLHSFFLFCSLFGLIRRLKKEKKVELINAQWLFPDGVASAWAGRLLKIPVVLTAHGCDINWYPELFMRGPQIAGAIRSSRKLIVVSEAQKKKAHELGIEHGKIAVIPNGVDFGLYNPKDKQECRAQLKIGHEGKIILFVGQIIEVKGVNYLMEAASLLRKHSGQQFKIIALGEGHLMAQFRKFIAESGLTGVVEFLGAKPPEEVACWYGASDVVCLPSIREGCPCVVLEALASGRPVVASRVGGIPELIDDENGILCEPKKSEDLSKALAAAMEKEWQAQRIREKVQELSWQNTARKYIDIFTKVSLDGESSPRR